MIPIADKHKAFFTTCKGLKCDMAIVFRLDTANGNCIFARSQSILPQILLLCFFRKIPPNMIPSVGDQRRFLVVGFSDIILDSFVVRDDDIGITNGHRLRKAKNPSGYASPLIPTMFKAINIDDKPCAGKKPENREKTASRHAQNQHYIITANRFT